MNELSALLEARIERDPHHAALIDRDRAVTFRELGTLVDEVARRLASAGAMARIGVAVSMPNSIELVATLFAIWRAGAFAIELAPSLPAEDRAALATATGAAMLVTEPEGGSDAGIALDPLDGDARAPDADLACVNLTSGSTGRPKGVMLPARNLRRNAELYVEHVGLDHDEVTCLPLPLFFGMNKIALLANVLVGSAVLLERGATVPNALLASMRAHAATSLVAVPSMMRSLLRHGDLGSLPPLRRVRIGAGVVDGTLASELRTALPDARIVLSYGLTEIGLVAAMPLEESDRHPRACGRPIDEVAVVIDPAGEIVVRCDHAASGYWLDEQATRRTFTPDGVRTGDLGRLEDGYLVLTGRLGGIIKSGGENVAAADVEAAIVRHPLVEECAVVGVEDAWLGEAIVAFVVPRRDVELAEAELRRHCVRELDPIRRPKRYVIGRDVPRTETGKIRRTELVP